MKKEIENREDIELLVNVFYDKVKQNTTIGPIFSTIANVDWKKHLPKMYSFWASILLGEKSFDGNPMQIHVALAKKTPMTETEFNVWRAIFSETVHELFEGEKAQEAINRAENIARVMLFNIQKSTNKKE